MFADQVLDRHTAVDVGQLGGVGTAPAHLVELSGDLVLLLEDDNYPGEGYQACSWSGFCSYNSSSSAE